MAEESRVSSEVLEKQVASLHEQFTKLHEMLVETRNEIVATQIVLAHLLSKHVSLSQHSNLDFLALWIKLYDCDYQNTRMYKLVTSTYQELKRSTQSTTDTSENT